MPSLLADVLSILDHNISLEHGAIVQYLSHAYAIGEAGVGAEVITIARTEMRHLKIFGDLLVDLGGSPDLYRRGPMHLEADSAAQMMRNGVEAEADAIAAYEAALLRVDHPRAARMIERVLDDERFHHEQFAGFVAEAADLSATFPVAGPVDPAATKGVALLDPAVRAEYAAILQNVREFLQSREFRHRDRMLEPMIWGMKHIGLLADEIHEQAGAVNLLDLPSRTPPAEAIEVTRALLAAEEERLAIYDRIVEAGVGPELRLLLGNFSTHHRYSITELGREIERLAERARAGAHRCPFHGTWSPDPRVENLPQATEPAGPAGSIGSLLGQPQA